MHRFMGDCDALSDDMPIWAQAHSICAGMLVAKALLKQPVFQAGGVFPNANPVLK
jgi:hypothetical protein